MIEILANTELEYGDFSEILDQLRGQPGSVVCNNGNCVPQDLKLNVDVDAGAAPADGQAAGKEAAFAIGRQDVQELVSNHFWPRITATLAGISVLLTLVSMRLMMPAGMRWRRRRQAGSTTWETARR